MPKRTRANRIVVDTNVWISTLISRRLNRWIREEFDLLFSEELFEELKSTSAKRKFSRYFGTKDVDALIRLLRDVVEMVDVRSKVELCRDPKDNFLLALAKDGDADYLITGDADLLVLKEFEKTKIVTLAEFEDRCR